MVGSYNPMEQRQTQTSMQSVLSDLGYRQEMFKMTLDDSGPQGQLVYVQKFPVTLKSNQSLSRRVYFTNYFGWLGEIREHGIHPVMNEITVLAETGKWGISTNSVRTQILGELRGNDIVEVRFWLERASGKSNGTFDGMFEWRRVLSGGKYERVAISKLRTTWIQITGHGEARIASLPEATGRFMNKMLPRDLVSRPLENLPESLSGVRLGKKMFLSKKKAKFLLHTEIFQTTLEDSNLIGNIYFANYSKWLGRTADMFFYRLMPDAFKGTGQHGEFLCLNCEIEHLREAMPFDKVVVKMYPETVYECGLDLYFEYFRLNEDSSETKLAYARFKIVWAKREGEFNLSAIALPSTVLKEIERRIQCL